MLDEILKNLKLDTSINYNVIKIDIYSLLCFVRLFQKNIFRSVPGPIQIYFLLVLRIICLSYILKVNKNQNIQPVRGQTVNYFMSVLYKICLSRTGDLWFLKSLLCGKQYNSHKNGKYKKPPISSQQNFLCFQFCLSIF